MRILQLTHDWKWTGPAEPMLRLALAQRARGHDVFLGCPEPVCEGRSLVEEARDAGLAPTLTIEDARGFRPLGDRVDVRRIRSFLTEHRIELVHVWHTRDHLLALRAAGGLRRRGRCSLVRSYRIAGPISRAPWNRWLFGSGTDGLLCVSPQTAECNRGLRGGRPIAGAFGAVDFGRFYPGPVDAQVRESFGFTQEHRVVGIVARAQPHRRFDLLLDAAKRLFKMDPQARLLVIGRGTRHQSVAVEPAQRMGIADRIHFAGYIHHDFADALRAMDVFTFLVPGSDGTCRAVLEAAACGIPAVTSLRGALPEIVVDGETGFCLEENPQGFADAWERILDDSALRARLGNAAAGRARSLFRPDVFCDTVESLYREVLGIS